MAQDLKGCRVAVIATDGFEESELTEPVRALREAGVEVVIAAPKGTEIQGFRHFDKGEKVAVDCPLTQLKAEDLDGVVLPGGTINADQLRNNQDLQNLLQTLQTQGKPIAAICHAPWELVSAGMAAGRTLTSYHTLADDIRNAGGHWVDREVVRDGNLITSRQPGDLPAFNQALIGLLTDRALGGSHTRGLSSARMDVGLGGQPML